MRSIKNLLLFFSICTLLAVSCSKQTETITETVVQIQNDTATTFILVRHAETTGIGSNPDLSAVGNARAAELMSMLGHLDMDAVYSTAFNRTTQTATPTADDHGLTVTQYDGLDLDPFVDSALVDHPKGVLLVVGHSNTTPDLLNLLTGTTAYVDIPETEYDNLYIVSVYSKGQATVLHLKYGD